MFERHDVQRTLHGRVSGSSITAIYCCAPPRIRNNSAPTFSNLIAASSRRNSTLHVTAVATSDSNQAHHLCDNHSLSTNDHTMHTTPRSTFTVRSVVNLNFQFGWMSIEIFPVVCDPKPCLLRFNIQRMGQTKIAKLEMVTIRFAISRNVTRSPDWAALIN